MDFLRQIAICYTSIGTKNITYDHILSDLASGGISTYKEAAQKYYKGNEQSMYKTADRIKKEFYRDALDYNSYHNEAQRLVMEVRIRAASVHKLLSMGFRTVGIETAIQTYKAANKYHLFDVAAETASIISQHFGQHQGDSKLCKKWFTLYLKANHQRHITQEAKFQFALTTSKLRYNKSNDSKNISLLKEVIDQLSNYKSDAESYLYWNYYFQLNIIYHELTGNYDLILECAREGYKYFSDLPIDHQSARLLMVAYVMHGYNLLGKYSQVVYFASMIKDLKSKGGNKDLALLRLCKAHINLYQVNEALNIINKIKGKLKDVADKIDLYKSYCTGIHPPPPPKDDPDGMDIAYKINTLYCDILQGETDRYSHNYILKYIRRHGIAETREGVMLKILSIMRHRGYDEKKFRRYDDLRQQLTSSTSGLTEIEIMQYEIMLEKIDQLYA